MPPIKTFTFKYLNTDNTIIIKDYKQSLAYVQLMALVRTPEDWLIVI